MPELTSTVRCSTTSSSVPLSCSRPILLGGSSTDCPVTCSSLVSQFLYQPGSSLLMMKLCRPETSFLRAETRPGFPHLSLSYCRQLHSGLACLACCPFLDENSFQCPIFILCILPIMAVYWWIQHFYRLSVNNTQIKKNY